MPEPTDREQAITWATRVIKRPDGYDPEYVSAARYILQPDPLIEAVGRLCDRYHTFGITDTPDAHKLFREVCRLLGERRGN